jgi:AcrR family transcriptional regulator
MTAKRQNGSDGCTGERGGDVRRARLCAATLHEVAERGYTNAKTKQIAKQARVSTKTFYELYGTKEDCFLEALRETSQLIQSQTAEAIGNASPERASTTALNALVDFAVRQTDAFYALTHEALFAGAAAVAEREHLFTGVHAQIEAALEAASARAQAPDISAMILISGAIRLLGIAKRRGDLREELGDRLTEWAASYTAPCASHRWRGFIPEAAMLSAADPAAWASTATQPGEGRASPVSAAVKRAQRERILLATAEALYNNGYAKTRVADVVAASGLSRKVFYAHFRGKQEAVTALVTQVYEQVMGACASAFFASERPWPERVWDAGETMSRLLAANPRLAYVALGESVGYVLGPAVMDPDEMVLGFTVFLEDGYSYTPAAAQTSRVVGETIAGATFEVINHNVRNQRATDLPGWLPLIAYMVLAPFTGVRPASDFVDRKVAEYRA